MNLRKEHKRIKARDHYPSTGKFRGAAYVVCNLNARPYYTPSLTMLLHTTSRYDSLLFLIERIRQKQKNLKFNLISKTKEGHFSVTYGQIIIIYSLRFLNMPVTKIARTLKDSDFEIT